MISHSRHIREQKKIGTEQFKAKSQAQKKPVPSEVKNLGRRASSLAGLELHRMAVKSRVGDDFERLIKEMRTKVEDSAGVRPLGFPHVVKKRHTFYESEWKKRVNPDIHKRTHKRVGFDASGLTKSMRTPMVNVSDVTFEPVNKFVETLDDDWNCPVDPREASKFMPEGRPGKDLSNTHLNLFGESLVSRRGSRVTVVNSKAQSPHGSFSFMNSPKNGIPSDSKHFYTNKNRSSTFGGGLARSVLLDSWGNNTFGEAPSNDET